MIEMAICAVQLPLRQSIAPMPNHDSIQLAKPLSRPNSCANTSVDAATEVAYGMIIETRKNVAHPHRVVEQVREAQGQQQLRHRRDARRW